MARNVLPGVKGFVSVPLEERFWAKVSRASAEECWLWTGSKGTRGYGIFYVGGKNLRASRIAWELTNGEPFPADMDACHSCDNPPCCNPAHIWPGTAQDNARDAQAKGRLWQPTTHRTHCPLGHPYAGENLYVAPKSKKRYCKICKVAALREARARKKQAALTQGKGGVNG